VTPPGAGHEGTLEAARVLLHNTLGPGTSPSAVEQWRHNVDQLIITAINTLLHGGKLATTLVGCQSHLQCTHARRWQHTRWWWRALRYHHAPVASLTTARDRIVASPSSTAEGGTATLTVTLVQQTPLLSGKLLAPLHPHDLGVVAWRLTHISEWWSGCTNSGPTYQRSTSGASMPPPSVTP
jgi:hypothetical protein